MSPTTRGLVALAAIATCVLSACGGGAAAPDAPDAAATDDVTAQAAEPSSSAAGETVEVTAVDYAYEGLPATVAAGSQLALTNTSTEELHEMVVFRLPDDEARPVAEILALPEDEAGAMLGGEPAAVILAPPGEAGFPAVGDGTLAERGRYAVICSIPTGADPQEYLDAPATDGPPDIDGGPPHFTVGMLAELVVE